MSVERSLSPSGEAPSKVVRYEDKSTACSGKDTIANAKKDIPTFFIRSSQIHSRGDLVNGFLSENKVKLGIQEWFNSEGILQADAPVECVFVKTSRKPYFLLEFTHDVGSSAGPAEALKSLDKTIYKDHPVTVMLAKDGLTVAEERKKLELRDNARRHTVLAKESHVDSNPLKSSVPTAFVPRVLRKR